MNLLRKNGLPHSSARAATSPTSDPTSHIIAVSDCLAMLRSIPAESIQLVICDPPYNINVAAWDDLAHYVDWAGQWLSEVDSAQVAPLRRLALESSTRPASCCGAMMRSCGDAGSIMKAVKRSVAPAHPNKLD